MHIILQGLLIDRAIVSDINLNLGGDNWHINTTGDWILYDSIGRVTLACIAFENVECTLPLLIKKKVVEINSTPHPKLIGKQLIIIHFDNGYTLEVEFKPDEFETFVFSNLEKDCFYCL
jgi:hypothetical protein